MIIMVATLFVMCVPQHQAIESIGCPLPCSKNPSNSYEYGPPLSRHPTTCDRCVLKAVGARIKNITNAIHVRHILSFPPTSDAYSSFPRLSARWMKSRSCARWAGRTLISLQGYCRGVGGRGARVCVLLLRNLGNNPAR